MESGVLGNYSSAGCSVNAESTATLMYWSCNFGAFRGLGGLPAGRVELRAEKNCLRPGKPLLTGLQPSPEQPSGRAGRGHCAGSAVQPGAGRPGDCHALLHGRLRAAHRGGHGRAEGVRRWPRWKGNPACAGWWKTAANTSSRRKRERSSPTPPRTGRSSPTRYPIWTSGMPKTAR